jgi:excisionase family DNA binding protein
LLGYLLEERRERVGAIKKPVAERHVERTAHFCREPDGRLYMGRNDLMIHVADESYPPVRSPLLTVNETAAYMNVARATVFRLVRRGELNSVRVGSRLRFRPEDVERYLERGSP